MKLLLVLFCLAQDGVEFPVFERDPWDGCGPGSMVKKKTTEGKQTREETLAVAAVEKDVRILERSPVEEDEDGAFEYRFIPFFDAFKNEGSGYKETGRSTKYVTAGGRKVKAQVREYAPPEDTEGGNVWRIATADEFPGGVAEITWRYDDGSNRVSLSYAFQGMEKLKVGDRDVECARYSLVGSESAEKKKTEGTYWLSSSVPGMLVKAKIRRTMDKSATERTVEVVAFEKK